MTDPTSHGRPRMKVVVCGDTGTGKTVYLTCLSQTILEAFPHEYIVDFDRYSRDNNATYYGNIAEEIYKTGKTEGTLTSALQPLTLLLTPARVQDEIRFPPIAVDLMDFAGGNFNALASLTITLENSDSDPAMRDALRRVHAYIESADAFVILVSARDLVSPSPNRPLFTPSVNSLLALCRLKRKPVALVLSQSHSVSQTTVDEWMRSPRVELFRRHFSAEPREDRSDDRPFGIVRALTCYREISEGLEPQRQSGDNSIWLKHAADVVAELVWEAVPAVIQRHEADLWVPPDDDAESRIPASSIALSEPSKVVIAVCGAQGAGKTVFLTCLFRTFTSRVFGDDVLASFNKEGSDAGHWQRIEDEITKGDDTIGTLAPALHSVEFTVEPLHDSEGELTIEMMDFAGRHFETWANAALAGVENGDAPTDQAAADEVRTFLDNANAFVILVSALDIDPARGAERRDGFTPSVDLVLRHAQKHRKPVALLFSQADRAPAVTDAFVRRLTRVKDFERHFTSRTTEGANGTKPFGVVRTITCYEKGPSHVNRQGNTGSIWRSEPAEVVASLVLPLVEAKRQEIEKERIRKEQEEEERRRKAERRNRFGWAGSIGVLLLLLTVGVMSFILTGHYRRTADAQVLRTAAVAMASEPVQAIDHAEVERVMRDNGARLNSGPLGEALGELENAMSGAARRLDQTPRVENSYIAEIDTLTSAVRVVGAHRVAAWLDVSERLEPRRAFLQRWLTSPPKEWRDRWGLLAAEGNRFAADASFAEQIRAIGTREKVEALNSWHGGIPPATTLAAEIARVLELLHLASRVEDVEYTKLARRYGAYHLAGMLLALRENGLIVNDIIRPMVTDLANTPSPQRQFTVFVDRAVACEPYECRDRLLNVNAAIERSAREGGELTAAVLNAWGNLLPASEGAREERLEIWRAVAEAMSNFYAFTMQANAWPPNLKPLPRRIEDTLAQARRSGTDPSAELMARLSRPLYCEEMIYLHRSLVWRSLGQSLPPSALEVPEPCRPSTGAQ